MDCVGYSLGTNMFEAYPLVLIKKEYLNLNAPKQGKCYGKIINRNSSVKIDKNYKERYEIGNEINYYNMLSGASDSILTHKSRPVKVWNQMAELWCLFNVKTVAVKLANTRKTTLMIVSILFLFVQEVTFLI